MAESSKPEKPQPKIVESIISAAKDAFNPSADPSTRDSGLQQYNELVERTQTWILLHALNGLIKPDVLPPWLRTPLMQTLTLLPLRPDGVRATMEFVFAVHPSSACQSADAGPRGKEGADITHEAVAVATKLLSSVPSSQSPDQWFGGIWEQLFALFDGEAGPDVAKTAAQVVGFGILGKKQYGAPGAPGWNAFVQPLLESLNPSLKNKSKSNDGASIELEGEDAEVIDLGKDKILVAQDKLERSLRRLELLVVSNPSPGLCKRVLTPVLLPIWAIASWTSPSPNVEKNICRPARGLVQTYLRLFGNADNVTSLIRDLLYKGHTEGEEIMWRYNQTTNGGIEVIEPRNRLDSELNWAEVEDKAATLVAFISLMCPAEVISTVFLGLLRRWIQTISRQGGSAILIKPHEEGVDETLHDLVDLTVLEKLMDKAPEKLVSHFDQLLELVCQVLHADSQSPLGDDIIGIILSLLNLVITSPTFQKLDVNPPELQIVQESLERIGLGDRTDISATARNLTMLLKYRDGLEEPSRPGPAPSSRQVEDRKTYNLAMNYITGDSENPPPVVSEGLNLLSGLILAESPILDISGIIVLMSSLLKENEDFINLRVIRIFTQLANKHPRSTMQELIDHYLDAQERLSTDVRLRFGEAILQVIERLGETFSGEVAQNAGESLLSIAGRRGYRPKTMARQAREERLESLKRKKAGSTPDVDMNNEDEGEEETADDKANNDVLAQILRGWESKRGSEDVRMRASALSVFGSAIETNIIGMGPSLVSTGVDLSINILTMEPELEKAILRRAAILLILSFCKAMDQARQAGRKLGFGLTDESRQDMLRTLNYVAETDNDGLVKQHARDVAESLEHWGMMSLLPTQAEAEANVPGLTRLAGLRINPRGNAITDEGENPRPRIEEIE